MSLIGLVYVTALVLASCTNPTQPDIVPVEATVTEERHMNPIPVREHYFFTDDRRLFGVEQRTVESIQPTERVTVIDGERTTESDRPVSLETFSRDSGKLYYTVPHAETEGEGEAARTVETREYVKQDGETVTTLAKEHKAPALARAVYESGNYRVTVERWDGGEISAVYHGDMREPLAYVSEAVETPEGLLMSVRESRRSTRPHGLVLWQRETGRMVSLYSAVGRLY